MDRNVDSVVMSVDRALALLTLLGREESVSVTAAARTLDVAPSTAHRLLATLVARGFAAQDSRRRYAAGPALLAPGQARPAPSVVDHVRPYLEQLFETTAETCHLMVRAGDDVQFVDGIEGAQMLRVGLRTGMRMPAHTTSGGKAMLAELDDGEPAPARTGMAPRSGRSDDGRAARAESRLGVNRDESEPGVTAIGASIGVVHGHHAALSVAIPTARLTTERVHVLSQQLLEICIAARAELMAGPADPFDVS